MGGWRITHARVRRNEIPPDDATITEFYEGSDAVSQRVLPKEVMPYRLNLGDWGTVRKEYGLDVNKLEPGEEITVFPKNRERG